MEKTLGTRHATHIFQGKNSIQRSVVKTLLSEKLGMLLTCYTDLILFLLLFAGHMVASSAHRTVLLTPQTASTSLESEAGQCSRILCVLLA